MNFNNLRQEFNKMKRKSATPSIFATIDNKKIGLKPKDVLDLFIEAIRAESFPKDHKLFPIFSRAAEDREQGQIFGCLRKLAQGLEPIKGEDLFLPTGKARESILKSTERHNIWHGSVRSSKTVMSCIRWLQYVLHGPRGHLMMLGQTIDTLGLNVLEVIRDLMPACLLFHSGWRHCVIFGRWIILRGASNAREEFKLRGPTLAGIYCDEITTWPKVIWKIIISRISRPGAMSFSTTNPDGPYHHLKLEVLDRIKELSLTVWHFVLDDNPGLTSDYIENLKKEYVPGSVFYMRFILGLWVAAEGRIYDFLSEDAKDDKGLPIIVDSLPPSFDRWRVAVDYGTRTCFGLYGRANAVWYKVKEYYYDDREKRRSRVTSEHSAEMKKFLTWNDQPIRPVAVEVDPSATEFIAQLRKDFPNLIIYDAINDVLPGIQIEAKALVLGWLKIFKGCVKTIEEHFSYLWDEKAQENGKDKPIKKNDHTCDETRYFCARQFMTIGKVGAKPAGL